MKSRSVKQDVLVRVGRTLFLGLMGIASIAAVAGEQSNNELRLRTQAMEKLKLAQCEVPKLELPSQGDLARASRENMEVVISVPLDGHRYELVLRPHSLRAANFRLLVQRADGVHDETPPLPATWRGYIRGETGSVVVASLSREGIAASVRNSEGQRWSVQPLGLSVTAAPMGFHVLYHAQDALPSPLGCGEGLSAGSVASHSPLHSPLGGPGPGGSASTFYFARIAFDADVDYYNSMGTVEDTVNSIEGLLNEVDNIYTRDVQIGYQLVTIMVRTTDPEPYTSSDAPTLLGQLQAEWNNNHADIARDVVHLLTGKAIYKGGDQIAGISFGPYATNPLGVICNEPLDAYSLTSDNILADTHDRRVNLMAHELGHNWGAYHCDDPIIGDGCTDMNGLVGIMASTAPPYAPSFGDQSKSQIITHRNTLNSCLSIGWIYVDWAAVSPFWGTEEHPLRTVLEGVTEVPLGGQVLLSPGNYNEQISITKPLRLRTVTGSAKIGAH
jgi:hypothetical protein